MGRLAKVPNVDDPNQDANGGNDLGQHVTKVIQLLLERRRGRDLRRDALMNVTNGSATASQDDNRSRMARYDRRARKQHVDLVLLDSILVLDRLDALSDALALAREDRLVDAEAVGLERQNAAVGWDAVSDRDGDDVAGNELVGLDAPELAVANNLCVEGRVFLESGNGLFGAGFLGHANDGIEDEDGEDLYSSW